MREYQRDPTYNNQSRGYREEERALEVLETLYPSREAMLTALEPDVPPAPKAGEKSDG
jgi:hypothetical protein